MLTDKKVIIVEGLSDKKRIEKLIIEDVDIIVTHGTFSLSRFDELLIEYDLDEREILILVDADRSGKQLRKALTAQLPHATHIYIPEVYKEVEKTPLEILAKLLIQKHVAVELRLFGLDGFSYEGN